MVVVAAVLGLVVVACSGSAPAAPGGGQATSAPAAGGLELEEAAVLDGCRWWQLLAYLYVPLIRPALIAFSIVSITFHWNDFLWPLLVTNTPAARPLTVGLASFATAGENGAQFPLIMAGALLVMAPVVVGFLLFQRHFVASFAQSGFK